MTTDLRQSFLELPDAIRGWLTSDRVMQAIGEINRELGYRGEMTGLISWLITRLAVKDLHPKYFIHELMDYTGEDFDRAKSVTQEIDSKIFRRIETDFDRQGIDLNSLYLGKELPSGQEIKKSRNQEITTTDGQEGTTTDEPAFSTNKQWGVAGDGEQETDDEESIKAQKQENNTPIQTFKNLKIQTPAMPSGPMILHSEKDDVKPIAQLPITQKPRLSITIPRKYSTPATPPPVTVRIETPDGQEIKKSRNQETTLKMPAPNELPKIIKVVHYSNFRTPLDPRSVYEGHNV